MLWGRGNYLGNLHRGMQCFSTFLPYSPTRQPNALAKIPILRATHALRERDQQIAAAYSLEAICIGFE
jgi:hypothetical protein